MHHNLPFSLIESITKEHGTPVYIYSQEVIERQYQRLTQAFSSPKVRFFYACKALSNINILKVLRNAGCGLDTVSVNEVRLGLMAGFAPENIIYTPNSVSFDEIEEVLALGVHINIDNISILELFGAKYSNTYPVMIRLNPHIMAGGNYNISTGHIDSKFGISIHQTRHLQRVIKALNIKVQGLHMHTGSEIKDIQVFMNSMEVILELVEDFPDVTYIDLGSGFKVPYKPDEKATNVEELASKVLERLSAFEAKSGRSLEVWFEPGKYLVSEAGLFVAKVNIVKTTPATVFIGLNSGFNHLIRPMFYQAHHEIVNLSNPNGAERIYTIVGNLCETDTFAWDRMMTEVKEGDFIGFYNAGAYCFEMSMNYNARTKPAEILVDRDMKPHLIRKPQTFEDLTRDLVLMS